MLKNSSTPGLSIAVPCHGQISFSCQANLNAKDVELHCPLHYGAILNDVDTCKELLDANAKTGCRDMNGFLKRFDGDLDEA